MFRILFGFVVGIICIPVVLLYWYGHAGVPVAVADRPFPHEREIVGRFLHDRINKELVQIPPFQPDGDTLIAGAHIYAQKCAVCHGLHGKVAPLGEDMYPLAPPLWEKHHNSEVVGVSDDPPGETYWKVANGIRLTGMPEFKTALTDAELWQVTLLLANADKPLPPEAVTTLRGEPATAHTKGPSDSTPHPGTLDE